jgi:DNA-directed RNA polymerase specialized sigma subunit
VNSLRTLATKVNTTFGEERVNSTKKQSPMEETIVKLMDLENEVNKDIDELIKLKGEIIETINQVDDPIYQLILERRYVEGKTWEEIAAGLGYDRSTVWRNHGKALKEIFKILNNATICN